MSEEIDIILEEAKSGMEKSIHHLERQLRNIRAGKANVNMLSSVMVDYYGTPTPLQQVANVNTPDARTLSIQPWEKSLIPEIEKGIMKANLGLNPQNNGESVIINVPTLTEERRKDLAKQARAEGEDAKISIRNERKQAMNELKNADISEDLQKNAENEVQELTDKYSEKVDKMITEKEKEIMTV